MSVPQLVSSTSESVHLHEFPEQPGFAILLCNVIPSALHVYVPVPYAVPQLVGVPG